MHVLERGNNSRVQPDFYYPRCDIAHHHGTHDLQKIGRELLGKEGEDSCEVAKQGFDTGIRLSVEREGILTIRVNTRL